MEGPKMARHLPRRLKGGLGVAAAVAAFGLVAATAAMTVGAWTFTVQTWQYTGSTQTANANAGQSIHDTAVITEPNSGYYVQAGTVTFNLYPTSACSSGTAVYTDPVPYTTVNTSSRTSGTITSGNYSLPTSITTAATYEWVATYYDSTEKTTWSSTCGQEPVNVYAQNQGAVSTVPTPNSGDPGTPLTDTATVTGIVDPAGTDTVSFALYLEDPSDPGSCADGTLINDFGASPLVGGTSGPWTATSSGSFAPTAAGTYLWQVQFNAVSDPNNLSSQVFCGEPVSLSTPAGGQLAASTTTPVTGSGLGSFGLIGGLAVLIGALTLFGATRIRRLRAIF